MNKTNTNDLRKAISEILVQNNMPTRQVAINELMGLIRDAEARGAERVIEAIPWDFRYTDGKVDREKSNERKKLIQDLKSKFLTK